MMRSLYRSIEDIACRSTRWLQLIFFQTVHCFVDRWWKRMALAILGAICLGNAGLTARGKAKRINRYLSFVGIYVVLDWCRLKRERLMRDS